MTQPTIPIQLPEPQSESQEERNHNPYIIAAILALSIVVVLFYRLSGSQVVPNEPLVNSGTPSRSGPSYIVVDVGGEVVRPSVYKLRVGSRVFDAIASAGGFTVRADKNRVNMAAKLRDEMKLVVPTLGQPALEPTASPEDIPVLEVPPLEDPPMDDPETPPSDLLTPAVEVSPVAPVLPPPPESSPEPLKTPVAVEVPPASRVSINRAAAGQLEEIPGIGPKLANEIVNYRKGPPPRAFTSLEELMQVPGIKQAKYDEIQPYIKL